MIRLWLMIALTRLGGEMQWRANRMGHLTTDPTCVEHREMPRPGSRLDLASRGLACGECMADRAFGRSEDVLARFVLDTVPKWCRDCGRLDGHSTHCPNHENRSKR